MKNSGYEKSRKQSDGVWRDCDRRDTHRGQVAGRHSRGAQGNSAHLHDPQMHRRIFALLTEQIRPGINLKVGRPGNFGLVLAVLKQGLGCDYDHLQEIADAYSYEMMRWSSFAFAIGTVFGHMNEP